jgi:O-antigen ligase
MGDECREKISSLKLPPAHIIFRIFSVYSKWVIMSLLATRYAQCKQNGIENLSLQRYSSYYCFTGIRMLRKLFTAPVLFCLLFFAVFPACVSYDLPDPFITPRVILSGVSLLVLSLLAFFRPAGGEGMNRIPVYALLVFMLLTALSVWNSLNPGDAWYEWMKSFTGFGVIMLSALLFQKEESRYALLKFSQFGVLLLSVVYGSQWLHFLDNQNLDIVFDLKLHLASTMGNKNFYAELICMLLPFSAIAFFTLKKGWKLLSLFNCAALLTSLMLTQSFAALAGCVVAALFVAAIFYSARGNKRPVSWKVVAATGVAAVLLGFAAFRMGIMKNITFRAQTVVQYLKNPAMLDSTGLANSNSIYERMMLWRNSLELIKRNPLAGCGAGNWKLLYPEFGIGGTRYIEGGNVHYEHPHNDYLLIASESGIPAVAAFILFIFSLAWFSAKAMRKNPEHRLWLAGILFAVVSFAIVSLFSFPRVRLYAWIVLCTHAGILLAVTALTETGMARSWLKPVLLVCAAIALWTFTAGLSRYKSEVHSKMLQLSKKQRNFARIVRESEKASSYYFPVDETATPLTWYKGMALFYSGNVAQAKAAYEDALQKNPFHIQLLNDLATTYEQTNEREKAIVLYKRALTVTPNFPHSILNISACYFNLGKRDSAFIYIDKLYGIKLNGSERKSYNVYLPAILREKINSTAEIFPLEIRKRILASAADSAMAVSVYRRSKASYLPFEKQLEDSVLKMR